MKRVFFLDEKEIKIPSPTLCEMTKTHIISTGTEATTITFDLHDAVVEFTRIKTPADVKRYASKYGMLGLHLRPSDFMNELENIKAALTPTPEQTTESIELWLYLASYLRNFIQLSRILKHPEDIGKFGTFIDGKFFWNDFGTPESMQEDPHEFFAYLEFINGQDGIMREVLIRSIYERYIAKVLVPPLVFVDFSFDPSNKKSMLNGRSCTYHLLAALFYGAWGIVAGDGTQVDRCDECGGLMIVRRKRIGTGQYCSPKCKMKSRRRNG